MLIYSHREVDKQPGVGLFPLTAGNNEVVQVLVRETNMCKLLCYYTDVCNYNLHFNVLKLLSLHCFGFEDLCLSKLGHFGLRFIPRVLAKISLHFKLEYLTSIITLLVR